MSNFIESDTVFVSDMFLEEYGGGAERSTEALFETSPYKTFKCKSNELNQELIQGGVGKLWVFFNYRNMDHNLIPLIVANLNYMIVEYDYKFCQYRSLDLHKRETGNDCDCHDTQLGKIVSAFLHGAEHIFWMSKEQSSLYHEKFPFLRDNSQTVLSSIFSEKDLEYIESLYNKRQKDGWKKTTWAVIDGNSWIKGVKESVEKVNSMMPNNKVEVLGGLAYYDLLSKLSEYHGLSFHPLGGDTCPRTVIEAKLLGMQLTTNDNVQHKDEAWFKKTKDEIEDYLLSRHQVFWGKVTSFLERKITLSGYTTTKNVIASDYPWEASIHSLLGFCDEVVVVDGGSDDGTWEALEKWSEKEEKLRVYQVKRDWNNYRFAVFDGQQKAVARSLCKGDWCWQMDIDEVVHENDYEKVKKLARQIPKSVKLVCLPVIDYWGKEDKVRVDVNPWKWRLSRNDTHITHDIPAQHRRYDEKGNVYSIGSDGCDYVHTDNYQPIPHMNFYTPQHEQIRQQILNDRNFRDKNLENYSSFINAAIKELPGVHHYSWFDIKRKIFTYKNYWSKHWASLYNKVTDDIPENNMFFDKCWSDVNDDEIVNLANKMNNELGGWVFHTRVDFDKPTPWYKINCDHPELIKPWLEERK
jgi:glycosyltransferase involved in cell wall biosynthesis|tara:strand:- start:1675 stop:3585 length:1911 start_codon:yes stop_codon:yes gene_type:complete